MEAGRNKNTGPEKYKINPSWASPRIGPASLHSQFCAQIQADKLAPQCNIDQNNRTSIDVEVKEELNADTKSTPSGYVSVRRNQHASNMRSTRRKQPSSAHNIQRKQRNGEKQERTVQHCRVAWQQ